MKKTVRLTAIMLILAGSFGCDKEEDIDFSNIENLYAQPLPVIQKAVQGKWRVYQSISDGFHLDIQYPENTFMEFKNDHYIIYNAESQNVFYFTWKKLPIENWRNPLDGHETYIMDGGDRINNWYFERIKNDTLFLGARRAPIWLNVIRVK
jgi:hypothetical protein